MCGIAGIMTVDGSPPDGPVLQRLEDALAHRGPDGNGKTTTGSVALTHTRLAIIDLETGDQPIFASTNVDDEAAIVANGEIYNYVELRRDMDGVDFRTRSDVEPALHLYLRHGLDFTRHLRGMYAIAIHDPVSDSLVLARDPFGIKPLYYAETETVFVFASEAQAIHKSGLVRPLLRPEGAKQLLQLKFTCGAETAFEGIMRVLPGETLVVRQGRIVERRRRQALPDGGPTDWDEEEASRRLDEALTDSVSVHQRSDVPYGMFLSGGVDSSMLLAYMRDLNDTPVQTFTAGFSGTDVHDERDHAQTVAQAAGASFEAMEFSFDDFWRLLPAAAAAMDDPAADYAVLPTYKLARLARDRGLKVILSGEGGDEIFGGYSRYRRVTRPWFLGGRAIRRRGVFDGLGVLGEAAAGSPADFSWRAGIARAEIDEAKPGRTRIQVAQAVDCADWLPHDLLGKMDRCLMAFGVEGRVPFLDARVAEAAFRLPDRLKVRSGKGKWLLRRLLERKLPEARPFSRKRGFTVPVGHWIAERGRELGPLVARQPGVEEACRPGEVERLFAASGKRVGQAAWNLLFFALWHR
ncbi:MAG: asparagine synthase (glutamine-hydrolyzing), partial [Rhodospirillales bacterium]